MNKHLFFLKHFFKHPQSQGAVAPSSRALSKAMVAHLDLEHATYVVEYGPGLGAFTREILAKGNKGMRFLGIEKNPAFVEFLREEFPNARIVAGDAKDVMNFLGHLPINKVDAVVSGLPFSNFRPEVQSEILRNTCAVLKPGGSFVSFSYMHTWPLNSAKRFRKMLDDIFSSVTWHPVMKNVPPAFVVECRKGENACPCVYCSVCQGWAIKGHSSESL